MKNKIDRGCLELIILFIIIISLIIGIDYYGSKKSIEPKPLRDTIYINGEDTFYSHPKLRDVITPDKEEYFK